MPKIEGNTNREKENGSWPSMNDNGWRKIEEDADNILKTDLQGGLENEILPTDKTKSPTAPNRRHVKI